MGTVLGNIVRAQSRPHVSHHIGVVPPSGQRRSGRNVSRHDALRDMNTKRSAFC